MRLLDTACPNIGKSESSVHLLVTPVIRSKTVNAHTIEEGIFTILRLHGIIEIIVVVESLSLSLSRQCGSVLALHKGRNELRRWNRKGERKRREEKGNGENSAMDSFIALTNLINNFETDSPSPAN